MIIMQIIASSFMFWKEKFSEQHLVYLKNAGFSGFEMFCYRNYLDWKNRTEMDKLLHAMRVNQFTISSMHAPWTKGVENEWYDIASLDHRIREKALKEIFEAVEIFKKAGAKFLVVHPGMDKFKSTTKNQYMENAVHSLKLISLFAHELGIQVLIENPPPPEIGSSVDEIKEIFKGLRDYKPGFCFDIGHANITNEGIDAFLTSGLFPSELHISDNHGQKDEHLLPGEGSIDWGSFFTKVKHRFGERVSEIKFNFELGRFPGTAVLIKLREKFSIF
ncbi:MAG: hypothetical protein DRP57_13720 [Spirochaetes bacterium]|nr:MAG: hypothetical protein DRP57_13720 [Spirochaetota bacterium]